MACCSIQGWGCTYRVLHVPASVARLFDADAAVCTRPAQTVCQMESSSAYRPALCVSSAFCSSLCLMRFICGSLHRIVELQGLPFAVLLPVSPALCHARPCLHYCRLAVPHCLTSHWRLGRRRKKPRYSNSSSVCMPGNVPNFPSQRQAGYSSHSATKAAAPLSMVPSFVCT